MPGTVRQEMTWHELNQQALMREVARLREMLTSAAAAHSGAQPTVSDNQATSSDLPMAEAEDAGAAFTALDRLCEVFGLSAFERDILLMAAGMELEAGFASACAAAQGDARRNYPTFGLALALSPHAHWSALLPTAPLRFWRLVELGSGPTLSTSPLRIDERILHLLTGLSYLDERLASLMDPVGDEGLEHFTAAQQQQVAHMVPVVLRGSSLASSVLIQLVGEDGLTRRRLARAVADAAQCRLYRLPAAALTRVSQDLPTVARLWSREALLSRHLLLIECEGTESGESSQGGPGGQDALLKSLLDSLRVPVILSLAERRSLGQRPCVTVEVMPLSPRERHEVWKRALGESAGGLNGAVESVSRQFALSPGDIQAAASAILPSDAAPMEPTRAAQLLEDHLWDICRRQARPRLEALAQRIEPAATWDDLVLPDQPKQLLREICLHVRHRSTVYDTWGFAEKGTRGLGVSALFAGASGTGKTMAAEVLAHTLRLDLYRIDLSQVVSKYIGETEKNLRHVFDAAEGGAAILLFDEADALFGKRSEVKDSHDRYANVEVSYLLQRMESYRGLAILTSNMKTALDQAFLRRIRFVVQFPFPDQWQRADMWRQVFPPGVPTGALDWERLGRLHVAGGHIRSIAMNAAFLAAERQEPVGMAHLLHAARSEYAKLDKPLTEAEISGWIA